MSGSGDWGPLNEASLRREAGDLREAILLHGYSTGVHLVTWIAPNIPAASSLNCAMEAAFWCASNAVSSR
jgi:hypothetical protein